MEVLPADTEFELRMELRDVDEGDKRLLAAVLAEWEAGRVWLGGNVARGLGGFKLDDVIYKTLDLGTADNLLAFLKQDEPWQKAEPETKWLQDQVRLIQTTAPPDQELPIARRWVTITGTLQAQGPLLTNDATISGQTGFDHAPLLAQLGDWEHPVLAGSGLRGVLRSHAERIARTLATRKASGEKVFLHTCPACSPVESDADEPLASCDALLRGKVSANDEVDDEHLCLACRLFGSTRRGSRLLVEVARFEGDKPVLKMMDFLAVDRFTCGGAEGAKFDALALWKPAFKLRLYLENPAPWELGWLALVLRDLQEGWLTVGFGAAKGFGRVKLQDWTATFGYLTSEDLPAGLEEPQSPGKSGVFKTAQVLGGTDNWAATAKQWVDAFREQANHFERTDLPALQADSYFGQDSDLTVLYPSEVTL
jgi:CRISPR/Cas system CSM-associated protein Csm3 (group 7 of RAMP superfamily)